MAGDIFGLPPLAPLNEGLFYCDGVTGTLFYSFDGGPYGPLAVSSVANVLHFGAVGDGLADDAPAFQAAIDEVEGQGGGVVFAPWAENGYLLDATLLISASRVRLIGEGSRLINFQPDDPVIQIRGTSPSPITDCVVEGFRITSPEDVGEGNNTHVDARYANRLRVSDLLSEGARIDGLFARNCDDLLVERCHFEDTRLIGCITYECRRVTFAFCRSNLAGYGFQFKNTSDSRMIGCTSLASDDYGLYLFDDGLGSFRSTDNALIDCHAISSGLIGIHVHTSPYTRVIGCKARTTNGNGISITGSDRSKVIGSSCRSNGGAGIGLGTSDHCQVSGNDCVENAADGIVNAGGDGLSITGNICLDNGYPLSSFTYSGIRLLTGTTNCAVTGNTCGREDTTNSRQLYGVDEQSGANSNTVVGNTLFGNATAEYRKSGAASVFFNGTGPLLSPSGIGVGNSAAATTPGSVVKKLEIFDATGVSLGYLPIYSSIG